MESLRIVFAGSPDAAVPSLRRLAAGPHEIATVVTRTDTPQGRARRLTPTAVATAAEELGLPIVKADRLGPVADELAAIQSDLGVVVAYGGLIREPLLGAPRLGWINLHFSLLPRWRGAAPVQRAIMSGDSETGAAVFQLVPELDAGPVYAVHRHRIGRHETAGHLLAELADDGAALLAGVVDSLAEGTAIGVPQSGEPTPAPKLSIEDGRLDLSRPVNELDARIRGVTPEPGAFVEWDDHRLKVLEAQPTHGELPLAPGMVEVRCGRVLLGTGSDPLELVTVHPAGRRAMAAADWWRGRAR